MRCALGLLLFVACTPESGSSSVAPAPQREHAAVLDIGRYAQVRTCYERGMAHAPQLRGRVVVRLVIAADGTVAKAEDAGSTLPDANVIACVLDVFRALVFAKPADGTLTAVYPFQFEPDEVDR